LLKSAFDARVFLFVKVQLRRHIAYAGEKPATQRLIKSVNAIDVLSLIKRKSAQVHLCDEMLVLRSWRQ